MPKLSINALDRIPAIPLTLDLIRERYRQPMTDDEARERLDTAQHEASHLVAAVACGCEINWVKLRVSARSTRKPAGGVLSSGLLLQHEAFGSFAGYVWECRHGDARRACGDMEDGLKHAKELGVPHEPLLAAAERFVLVDAVQVIRDAAVGIVCLMPTTGKLQGAKLKKLVDWLEPRTPRPAGIPPKQRKPKRAYMDPNSGPSKIWRGAYGPTPP